VRPGEDWLRSNAGAAPPQLLAEMSRALPGSAESNAEALVKGALALYAEVLRGTGGREDALPLLAADGLLTHAFQACADDDPEGLPEFARRWGGGGRLGELLP
jgi:hypothetical protein